MKLTKKQITAKNPCANGLAWLESNFKDDEIDHRNLINTLHSQKHFDWANWVFQNFPVNKFDEYTYVLVDNCPGLTALPALPKATDVRVYNCPGIKQK